MAYISRKLEDNIGTLTLDHYKKRNALSAALLDELIDGIGNLVRGRARVLVLRAGPDVKVWSAGHDVSELPTGKDPLPYSDPLERALRAVRQCPAPIIAMVHGSVWGGACELALNCDILIGDPTSAFAITPANLGVPYNASGILHFLRRVPLNVAKEMFFTGLPIDAERALRVGILNHLRPEEELESFTYEMAGRIASRSPQAVSAIKEQARIITGALPIAPETFERIDDLRRKVFEGQDYVEGLKAFGEKRQPVFPGE